MSTADSSNMFHGNPNPSLFDHLVNRLRMPLKRNWRTRGGASHHRARLGPESGLDAFLRQAEGSDRVDVRVREAAADHAFEAENHARKGPSPSGIGEDRHTGVQGDHPQTLSGYLWNGEIQGIRLLHPGWQKGRSGSLGGETPPMRGASPDEPVWPHLCAGILGMDSGSAEMTRRETPTLQPMPVCP
jgi:hypothetical protein